MLQKPPDILDLPEKSQTIKIDTSGDNVIHFAALPGGATSIEPVAFPENPVLEYDFELDEFQREAIAVVHNKESVLVSAHTSAGKTAIAYYAIKMALNSQSRVVYTSPIKALSNQKYRELKEKFDDVGLITGDVTTNPSASILVMTTEILRMMLYKGSELIRELSWVIYDEIHYMRDIERGVVWEESIILLPHQVRFVFLSATIPNAREFSEWIAHIHQQTCHVVYTEYRPVPLKYYLEPPGGEPILVKEGDGKIKEGQFQTAFDLSSIHSDGDQVVEPTNRVISGITINKRSNPNDQKPKRKNLNKEFMSKCTADAVLKLVSLEYVPMIVFAFGRKEVDKLPSLYGLKDAVLVTEEESQNINSLIDASIEKLTESDRSLPQISTLRSFLTRGIAVHHGGLIPLMKELIELLFQFGLIKVLIATETFAMGLNMPAKAVLFHSVYKFDGQQMRILTGGEFIQMSGRSGRRNNDSFGAVIISLSGEASSEEVHDLLTAEAQPLNSEFHVTYHMLLSLLCTEQMQPEKLMGQSFHQFQMEREIPQLKEKRIELQRKAEEITKSIVDENRVKMRVKVDEMLANFIEAEKNMVAKVENIGEFLRPGRIVEVNDNWGWGLIVRSPNRERKTVTVALRASFDQKTGQYFHYINPTDQASKQSESKTATTDPSSQSVPKRGDASLFEINLSDIVNVSPIVKDPQGQILDQIPKIFKQIKDMIQQRGKIDSIARESLISQQDITAYKTLISNIDNLKQRKPALEDVPSDQLELYKQKVDTLHQIYDLDAEIAKLTTAIYHQDLRAMRMTLERLGFTDKKGIITKKGRVASIITAGDELVMTELLFEGILSGSDITPQKIAALLCIFACDEGQKDEPDIPEEMQELWDKTVEIIDRVITVSNECGLNINRDEYMKKIDPTYMTLTYNWAAGAEFAQLMEDNSDFFEGSVIRSMKRTEEILRQAQRAASQMGNDDLSLNILKSIDAVKRDIIFSPSLYL